MSIYFHENAFQKIFLKVSSSVLCLCSLIFVWYGKWKRFSILQFHVYIAVTKTNITFFNNACLIFLCSITSKWYCVAAKDSVDVWWYRFYLTDFGGFSWFSIISYWNYVVLKNNLVPKKLNWHSNLSESQSLNRNFSKTQNHKCKNCLLK